MDPLRMCELQSVASGLSLSCDAPGAQSAGSIAHGSTPGARRATVLFLDSGFGVAVRTSESKATSAATGVFGMAERPAPPSRTQSSQKEREKLQTSQFGLAASVPCESNAPCSMRRLAAQPRVRSTARCQLCDRREGRRRAVHWKAGGGGDAQPPNDHAQQRHIA